MASDPTNSLQRGFAILRLLATDDGSGKRLVDIADAANLPRATVHRILRQLVEEKMAEHDKATRRYRLGLDLFILAASAGNRRNLRDLCRPALLRLTAELGETVFLLVRNGFDAVCIDRSAGPLPIRSFTGDIGGRVTLGIGQGATAILAYLPPAEQDTIIRSNLPRMQEYGIADEGFVRGEMARVRTLGYADGSFGLIPGMAGLGVPIFDHAGWAVAALSIGSTTDRLPPDRRPIIAEKLRAEADAISAALNPFDPVLLRAATAMEAAQ